MNKVLYDRLTWVPTVCTIFYNLIGVPHVCMRFKSERGGQHLHEVYNLKRVPKVLPSERGAQCLHEIL